MDLKAKGWIVGAAAIVAGAVSATACLGSSKTSGSGTSGTGGAEAGVGGNSGSSGSGATGGAAGTSDAGATGGVAGTGGSGPACGADSQPCCNGTTCNTGLICQTSGGTSSCQKTGPQGTGTPCSKRSDCGTGSCVPIGGGKNVCTTSCTSDSDCVPGWTCGAVQGTPSEVCQCTATTERCDGKDDNCDGIPDDEPAVDSWCSSTLGAGHVCQNGACVCTPANLCSGQCVDRQSDPNNCGTCGNKCATGGSCRNGTCACPVGQTACSGVCVDKQTDPNNCGTCGNKCATGAASCQNGTCTCPVGQTACGGTCVNAGTKVTINDIDTGKVGVGQSVELTDVVATSQKFLTYKSNSKGSCLWAVFATDGGQTAEGPATSIMIESYGNNATTTGTGTGPCPRGTDAIPDNVKPGDKLQIMLAKTEQYAPSTCTGGTVGALQLQVVQTCPITENGTATVPTPHLLTTTEANAIAAGTDAATLAKWGGALVELDNAIPSVGDGGSIVGQYGGIGFSNFNLTAGEKIFYDDVKDPGNPANAWQYASTPAAFSKIVGLIYLDYCTYEIAPGDKCTDVAPPSDDCP